MCRVVAISRVIVPRRHPGKGAYHPRYLDGRPRPSRMLQPPQVGTVDRPRYASLAGKELGHTMVIDVGEREPRSFMMLARHWHSHLLARNEGSVSTPEHTPTHPGTCQRPTSRFVGRTHRASRTFFKSQLHTPRRCPPPRGIESSPPRYQESLLTRYFWMARTIHHRS